MKAIAPLRLIAPLFAVWMLQACAPEPARTARRPVAQASPRPVATSTPALAPANWRDAAPSPGTWSYRQSGAQTAAVFGEPASEPRLSLTCDRVARTVSLARAGAAQSAMPMTVITTSDTRSLSAQPLAGPLPTLVARFNARDPFLDAIAFSRGRFAVEVNGLPTLYLPAWAEVARVIEDCR